MKRILVAVDSSEIAPTVVARAVEVARVVRAKLRLFRAVPPPFTVPPTGALVPIPVELVVSSARASLDGLLAGVPEEMRDGAVVGFGTTADAVSRAAQDYDASLVVIGAHAHGRLARALGTTAARIVNRVDRAVLIVRPEGTDAEEADTRETVRPHDHALRDAAVIAGAASGAVAGALAGPPGVVVGGAIGAAVGMLAGRALDRAEVRAADHDRELDDVIGVTKGSLGERDRAARGLRAIEAAERTGAAVIETDAIARAGDRLRHDHASLEVRYGSLMAAYESGDWRVVRDEWNVLEREVRVHMNAEEKHVLPAFAAVDAQEAGALLAEHDALRSLLDRIAVGIELHVVPLESMERFIAALRAHAAREERLLYPWADVEIAGEAIDVSSAA